MLYWLILMAHSSSFGDWTRQVCRLVFLPHILVFMSTDNVQNPNVNAIFSENRIICLSNIFIFSFVVLFCFGFIGLCSFLGKERKSENMNSFGIQSFIFS